MYISQIKKQGLEVVYEVPSVTQLVRVAMD